jgi:integrase
MKKGDWRPHTRNTNLRLIAKITDGPFGERTLDNITHRELKIWFDEVAPKNGHDQIRQMIGFLKQIYAYAVDEDYVKGDPVCYRLKMPSQANEVSRPVLDLKELATLQRGLADLPKGDALAVMTGSLTGMRPSELLSLRVKSFNEAGCILSITETEYLDSGPRIKVGKTKKSIRDVSISAELALRLRDWIKFEHPNPQPESFLFPARDGQLRWKSKAFLALVLYKLGKDLGIKVNFQILRRTVATLLAQEHEAVQPGQGTRKEMLAEIKQQFGHSQNSKVLEVAYIQDTPEKRANIAERFQLMLKAQVEKLQSASE